METISTYTYDRPIVASIAGYDPTGGAGLLADVKTFENTGSLGFGVQTAWTVQNEVKCFSINWLTYNDILRQLEPLLCHYKIEAIKIGLSYSLDNILNIVKTIKQYNPSIDMVWDPVISSSSNYTFLNDLDIKKVAEIMNHILLVTPNLPELLQLAGVQKEEEAFSILTSFGNVLLKGGHRYSNIGEDILYYNGVVEKFISKQNLPPKHGSGCILSSSIVSFLSQKYSLPEAVLLSKQYIEQRLSSNPNLLSYHA